MIYLCILILRKHSERTGEEKQEIINSSSSWPRPLLTLKPKVSREKREMVNQRVSSGPGPAPKGHLGLRFLVR